MLAKVTVTVDVDPKKWREEYGTEASKTAGDIRDYLQQFADDAIKRQVYNTLGVGRDEAQDAWLAENAETPMTSPND